MATILVVDDLAADREILTTLLRRQGHRLLEAADGSQGLAAVHAEHPDLVITDVLMPVMDGDEFVRQLRLDPATSAIPVVFYTAHYGGREARALARSSGVSWVLTKPAELEEALKIVGSALSGGPEGGVPPDASPPMAEFDREHLRLSTDTLSEKAGDLRTANARLRALINIGLELASERDPDRLLQSVCVAARDLFGATYVTLGIVDLKDRTVQRVVTCGTDAASWVKAGDSVSGILGTVVAERRTLRGDNPGGDPAGLKLPLLHPKVQAFLAAPVASPANVYGWFCLVGNEGRAFTENEQDLVTALSGQIGRIYESSHFHAVAQQRAEELEHEIVERKQAESALRHERDRAQRYLDTPEIILLALDVEGRITLVNRYACSVLGWTADELLGRDWIETCVPARDRDAVRKRFLGLLGGDLAVAENPILTRSGEERLIEWHNTVLRDDAGHVTGTFSSGADVTKRNQAVEALRVAEERMRFALQNAGVGIWDMDGAANVTHVSGILESQYGLQPGTFGGTLEAFIDRVHPDDRESVRETIGKAMKAGTDFSVQNRTIRPDGTVRWLSGAGRFHLGEHGEPVRGVGISLDVTERHTLEAQYQQAQRMEAVGRLAGGVAHDFNNLLSVILGWTGMALTDLPADHPVRESLEEVIKAGEGAARLTKQLLAFSRQQVVEPTLFNPNDLVVEMDKMLRRLIGEHIELVTRTDPALGTVKMDRGQLEQVLMNLVVNARDAMPQEGRLTIETQNVVLDNEYPLRRADVTPGEYVMLAVSDSGTGMSEEVKTRLFEPFFTTKAQGKGTGLGLATSYGIVQQAGGHIGVYSEEGVGTTMKVYLPRRGEAVVTAVRRKKTPVHGVETILLVEDEPAVRRVTARMLEARGYRVVSTASGDEALRVIGEEREPLQLLLTDVVLSGGMSGPVLAERVRALRPDLKVLFISGYTSDVTILHGLLEQSIALVQKPFTAESLGNKVREVLDAG